MSACQDLRFGGEQYCLHVGSERHRSPSSRERVSISCLVSAQGWRRNTRQCFFAIDRHIFLLGDIGGCTAVGSLIPVDSGFAPVSPSHTPIIIIISHPRRVWACPNTKLQCMYEPLPSRMPGFLPQSQRRQIVVKCISFKGHKKHVPPSSSSSSSSSYSNLLL